MPDGDEARAASDKRDSAVDQLACDGAARKTLIHELANSQKYQLDGSVWEAAAMIGLPGLHMVRQRQHRHGFDVQCVCPDALLRYLICDLH